MTVTAVTKRVDLDEIIPVSKILPWKVTDISIRPYHGFWSMNPSLHFDGELWRCVLRCADYAMPKGVVIRGPRARQSQVQSKNALVIFDPTTWHPIKVHLMRELDGIARVEPCASVGYEDMRLFRTERDGLQGIASSLHLDRPSPTLAALAKPAAPRAPTPRYWRGRNRVVDHAQPATAQAASSQPVGQPHPPEQVVLSFDDEYNVIDAKPLRGSWSGTPQKNWVPFDNCLEPRFLYSIENGIVFDDQGPLGEMGELATADRRVRPPVVGNPGGTEVKMVRRVLMVETGRAQRAGYPGLRGGSQLVHIGDAMTSVVGDIVGGTWLGIGHEMRFLQGKKWYYHSFYLTDSFGKTLAKSPVVKLAPEGIEFAAGMVVDGNRLVLSFGVEDMHCKIAETAFDAVLAVLEPITSDDNQAG